LKIELAPCRTDALASRNPGAQLFRSNKAIANDHSEEK